MPKAGIEKYVAALASGVVASMLPFFDTQKSWMLIMETEMSDPKWQAQPSPAEMNALIAVFNAGRLAEVENRASSLLELYPDAGQVWKLLGISLHLQGKDSLFALKRTAFLLPDDSGAHNNLGNALHDLGEHYGAVAAYRRAITLKPDFAMAHNNLGNVLNDIGQYQSALESYRCALKLNPGSADTNFGMGVALQNLERFNDAVAAYRRAIEIKPDFAEAHFNEGLTLHSLGLLDAALASYNRALDINPNLAEAHRRIGTILQDIGKLDTALASFRRAIEIKPDFAEAHFNEGFILTNLDQLDSAIESYRRALKIKPDYAAAHSNLGKVLNELGQPDSALRHFKKAMDLQYHVFWHTILSHLLLPIIPKSVGSIAEWREHYQQINTALMDRPGKLDEPGEELGSPSFYLAYHNADNRPIMEELCRLFRARVPGISFTSPHIPSWRPPSVTGQRIRVGFLSEFFNKHTIGSLYHGIIRHLDRKRFEVVVIHTPKSKMDDFRRNLDELADKILTLPSKLKNQQQAVSDEQLDVLFYPDIGMSSSTYFLAYARLAPVQATSWGHPDTTGLDTMDYFVSATSVEPDGAEANYTERLVRLNRRPCYYEIPKMPEKLPTRSELGLPETGILYGCPQTMYKFHPDFDAILATIADGDPEGRIVLLEGKHSAWTELLKARWNEKFPILLDRVIFLPPMSRSRFIALQSHMDVLLDPIHFGGGNTFCEAMLYGTPMVTWPGQYMRSRIVAGGYRQMGVADAPIAQRLEDYAPLALALGRDSKRRRALREVLLGAAKQELFEDNEAVREFEVFLEAAVEFAGRGELLPQGWRTDIQTGSAQINQSAYITPEPN